MRHPLDVAIASEQRRSVFLSLLGLTFLLGTVLYYLGAGLKTDTAGQGIVSFQLAGEPLVSQAILNSWGPSKRTIAQTVVGLDFAYLLLYSTALALGCVWASKLWTERAMTEFGAWLAWGLWAAGAFNIVQDFALLQILNYTEGPAPAKFATQTARFCALAKFGLIEAGLLYIAVSGFNYGLGQRLWFSGGAKLWDTLSSSATPVPTTEPPKAGSPGSMSA